MRKFSTTINGYDKQEVNKFVNDVTNEYESMLNKLKNKDTEISLLQNELQRFRNLETTMNKAALLAEESSNQLRKIAKEEADLIISTAKKNASQIVNDALIKAEKTDIETDRLRRSLKIYKARIRQVVEEQLSIVDDVDNIEMDRRSE